MDRSADGAGVLADAATVAYSYIGPDLTWAIYRNGTIGRAKEHLEQTAARLDSQLQAKGGRAFVSVNKALVTQASSAIPVVPLYISLLYKVMKAKGLHEGCIEQIERLFASASKRWQPQLDEMARADRRLGNARRRATGSCRALEGSHHRNLAALSDIAGYRTEFLKLFGFGLPGIDYEAESDPVQPLPSMSAPGRL